MKTAPLIGNLQQLGSALALGVALAAGPSPALAEVTGKTQERTGILLAQAGAEKQEYVVYVRQVDANGNLTEKTVEVRYTKNERGVIVPPDTKGGKLLDGRDSTGDAVRDRATNRQIIGQYDKDKQIVLAMTDKGDIMRTANRDLQIFRENVETNSVSMEILYRTYLAIYIYDNGANTHEQKAKVREMITMTDVYVNKKMHMNTIELEELKQKAKDTAKIHWQSVTRSLG